MDLFEESLLDIDDILLDSEVDPLFGFSLASMKTNMKEVHGKRTGTPQKPRLVEVIPAAPTPPNHVNVDWCNDNNGIVAVSTPTEHVTPAPSAEESQKNMLESPTINNNLYFENLGFITIPVADGGADAEAETALPGIGQTVQITGVGDEVLGLVGLDELVEYLGPISQDCNVVGPGSVVSQLEISEKEDEVYEEFDDLPSASTISSSGSNSPPLVATEAKKNKKKRRSTPKKPKMYEEPDPDNPRVKRAKYAKHYREKKKTKQEEEVTRLMKLLHASKQENLALNAKVSSLELSLKNCKEERVLTKDQTVHMLKNIVATVKKHGTKVVELTPALATLQGAKLTPTEIRKIASTENLQRHKIIFDLDPKEGQLVAEYQDC